MSSVCGALTALGLSWSARDLRQNDGQESPVSGLGSPVWSKRGTATSLTKPSILRVEKIEFRTGTTN